MRIIGIDYGTKRTGIALAESMNDASLSGALALPFEMFENLPDVQLAQAITDLVRREHIQHVIIGMPLNADGSVSNQSKITERFILTLTQHLPPTVSVTRFTEYLSSHDAESKLAGHFTRQQKRQRVDAIAAARILQDWIDQNQPGQPGISS